MDYDTSSVKDGKLVLSQTVALRVGGVSDLRQQNVVMSPAGLGTENDYAGEDQQQL